MKKPVTVTITGGAGQIGYALAFRVASGQLLGPDQPVSLNLLEITPALDALNGVVMELSDCAFPMLEKIVATDDPKVAFKDCGVGLLVGARPRGPGMERKDLLLANAQIFSAQGKAINEVASRDIKVLVVGNPANTNALIAAANAPDIDRANFTAMTRLDHNRALSQLGAKTGSHVTGIKQMIIWGNHSATQYPDIGALHRGRQAGEVAGGRRLVQGDLHPDRAAARRGHHQGTRRVVRRLGRLGRDRPRARLGARHARRQLGQHGRPVGRQLRYRGGRHVFLPGHLRQRPLLDRAGTRRSTSSAAARWTPPTRN